jgi:hypothetical protein
MIEDFNIFLKEQFNVSLSKIDKQSSDDKKTSQKEIMNTQEEIFEAALKKFKTTVKAKKLDKVMGLENTNY